MASKSPRVTPPPPGLHRGQESVLRQLIGRRVMAKPLEEETDAVRLLALAEHAVRKKNPPVCKYQRDFHAFATTMCYTKDEGAGGRVALIPDWDYLREVSDAVICYQPVLIEKSRRTLISWYICAFDLWLLAGGQDPRWPALMNSTENRKVTIGAQFKEGEAGSQDFLARLRFMVEQIDQRELRKLWPGFPSFDFSLDRGTGTNGSIVSAVPQGANKVRGSGITFIHYEELSFVEEAQSTVETALQTLRPSGHFCGITTAEANSYAAAIVNEKLREQGWSDIVSNSGQQTEEIGSGKLRLRRTVDDWYVLTVPFQVVPGYDLAVARRGMSEDAIQRELYINWTVSKGRSVYPEYSVDRHVASAPLEFDPSLPLHLGWDWLGCPACVITQLNTYGQLKVFPSLSPPESESIGIYEFAQRVADHLQRNYAAPNGLHLEDLQLIHSGDPSGRYPPTRTGNARRQESASAFEILNRGSRMYLGEDEDGEAIWEVRPGWGWIVLPGPIRIPDRLEAVRTRLTTGLKNGLSAIVIDPRADVVKNLLAGGYRHKQNPDGTFSYDPVKDFFSHTADALAYAVCSVFARPTAADEEDDETPVQGFQGAASGAHRRGYR